MGQEIDSLKKLLTERENQIAKEQRENAQLRAHEQKQGKKIASLKLQLKQQTQHTAINENNCRRIKHQCKIHHECTNYHTLNLPRRAPSYTVNKQSAKFDYQYPTKNAFYERRQAPQWHGAGRYRFTGPFTRMAVKGEVQSEGRCGTMVPGYIADPKAHNLKVGEMKDNVKVCHYSRQYRGILSPCVEGLSTKVNITRCPGNFLVYRLPNIGYGYCGAK